MSKFILWFARLVYRRIEKLKTRKLIEEARLNKLLKSLSYDEYLQFGLDTGLIVNDDYYEILKLRENGEKNV